MQEWSERQEKVEGQVRSYRLEEKGEVAEGRIQDWGLTGWVGTSSLPMNNSFVTLEIAPKISCLHLPQWRVHTLLWGCGENS